MNKVFKDSYEQGINEEKAKKLAEATDSSGSSRSPAAAPATEDKKNLSLDPVKFDSFLEDIWPSSATRRKIAGQSP